jgi:RNA polymerase sigma-70 factor, ECF subfamily
MTLPLLANAAPLEFKGYYHYYIDEVDVSNHEKELIERAASRDGEAFAQLYERYVDKIYRYIYYRNKKVQESEDLTAFVFLKAWEAISDCRWKGYPFSAWLYRIAHNQVIDFYRTWHETLSLDLARTREGEGDPVEAAERSSTSRQIRAALVHLTEEQRRVIVLRFALGYSTKEAAVIMDKEAGAVRSLQVRALRALQPWLSEETGSKIP